MLEEKVLETISKYNLVESGDKIVLGVSGGPDSISMLNLFHKFINDGTLNCGICVAHINHGLRENANGDELYVKNYCEERNIPFYVLHANVGELSKEQKRGLEETGRMVRYQFFEKVMKETESNKIAIAHNNNDKVETIIMNALRGSGLAGLKGIEPKMKHYIRPLIECTRDEIENYCGINSLNPRHDETNDENEYTRNKIRNIVIPYIKEEFNPNIINTFNRLSEIVKEDIDFVNLITKNTYEKVVLEENNLPESNEYNEEKPSEITLNLKEFNKEEQLIQKRLILYSIEKIFGDTHEIEKVNIDDIIKLCNRGIGNKFLMPNKKTKIVIKNKNIVIMSVI